MLKLTQPFSGLEQFVEQNVPLARFTWYRIGGPARWFIRPKSIEDLQEATRRCAEWNIRPYVLGLGANLLVSDAGVDGAVSSAGCGILAARAGEWGRRICWKLGAAPDMQKLVLRTIRQGLAGVECLAGIPGTVGGGIRMNAGGKFGDIGSTVHSVQLLDAHGNLYTRGKDELVFDYRSTNISAPVYLEAHTLELDEEDPERILLRKTKEIWMYKRNTQPLNTKNAGCIFKNPRGLSAGALIDQAGLKGMRVGGAEVSEKHANFIIAHPGCTADDVMMMIKLIREKVFDRNQIHLESEVRIWP